MNKKYPLFAVLVVQECGGNLYIRAKDVEEAKEKATILLDRNSASIQPDYTADGGYRIEDIQRLEVETEEGVSIAEDNEGTLEAELE